MKQSIGASRWYFTFEQGVCIMVTVIKYPRRAAMIDKKQVLRAVYLTTIMNTFLSGILLAIAVYLREVFGVELLHRGSDSLESLSLLWFCSVVTMFICLAASWIFE